LSPSSATTSSSVGYGSENIPENIPGGSDMTQSFRFGEDRAAVLAITPLEADIIAALGDADEQPCNERPSGVASRLRGGRAGVVGSAIVRDDAHYEIASSEGRNHR